MKTIVLLIICNSIFIAIVIVVERKFVLSLDDRIFFNDVNSFKTHFFGKKSFKFLEILWQQNLLKNQTFKNANLMKRKNYKKDRFFNIRLRKTIVYFLFLKTSTALVVWYQKEKRCNIYLLHLWGLLNVLVYLRHLWELEIYLGLSATSMRIRNISRSICDICEN